MTEELIPLNKSNDCGVICKRYVVYHEKYKMDNGEIRCKTCGILWSELHPE